MTTKKTFGAESHYRPSPDYNMRIDGIIKTWNDDRGFGFIEPVDGGQEIFVHIKAFNQLKGRPQPEQHVSFEVVLSPDGKKRAASVEFARHRSSARLSARNVKPQRKGAAVLIVISVFMTLMTLVHMFGDPHDWTIWLYLGASAITFVAYANDKAAAQTGSWRTPESTLHTLGLMGGWPGALLAQHFLRHKSVKTEFRATFWATVTLNVLALVLLSFPETQGYMSQLAANLAR